MKKVGILTFWGVANYGAWAQAYALNNVLQKLYGNEYQIEHIAYLEESHWNMYYKRDKRLENSFSYSWRLIPHTRVMLEKDLKNEHFDILIIGSDAVWEFSNPGFQDDYHMLAQGLSADKIYSYAASLGVFSATDLGNKFIIDSLKKFNGISVRDANTLRTLEELSNHRILPKLVVDPALLWDFKNDKRIITPTYDSYILVYGVAWDQSFVDNAIRFAKEKNMMLISVGYINSWCDLSLKMIELRTLEWIGFFQKAEYVFTSTFHGLMLGLNYGKQVKFNQVKYVKNRSDTLVQALGIPDHLKSFEEELNYVFVKKELEEMRKVSFQYLSEIFSGDGGE